MSLKPFLLERYFAKYEFTARHLLSSSDCDGWKQAEVLALADDETRELWSGLALGYTESRGLPLLRAEIAALYAGIEAEQVLVAAPQELIALAMNALLSPGDHVIATWPGYQSLHEIARSLGCEVDRWTPEEKDGWRFDPARLEALLRPSTKLVVVNFPHNPTGYLPPAADWARIVELARSRGAALFSDEMYRWLELDAKDRLPSACEAYERGMTLSGMSKSFGMAGARIGWLAAKDAALYARLCELKDYTTICSAASSEVLALIGLRAKDRIVARHLERARRNLGVLDAFFERRSRDFSWVRPTAGTIAFPRLLREERADAFCDRLVREAGVMLLPSTVYEYGAAHVRVGFGREKMPEALARLERFLDA
ncbi:MAG: aminotransferase class I/II-fold pyridoxal phosphate-dependent enzyme [Proteobacteria bacterium]|nr:aminotransferase class I/II-fold pyridoxal phosphate-dependent enzyme [Pseudomonadota bacterium]